MTNIDWSKPIEAIHTGGMVFPMTFDGKQWDSKEQKWFWMTASYPAANTNESWNEDGSDCCKRSGWRIQNVGAAEPEWHVEAQDIANNWTEPNDRAVAYQAAAEGIKLVRNVADTDTVMVKRVSEADALEAFDNATIPDHETMEGFALYSGWRAAYRHLGLIKPDPTPSDKFKSDHPEWALRDRSDLIDDCLAWATAKTPLGKMLYEAAKDLTR